MVMSKGQGLMVSWGWGQEARAQVGGGGVTDGHEQRT